MRRILIDRIRAKTRIKRGRDMERVEFIEEGTSAPAPDERILAINEALEELDRVDPESAELVKLRYFVGLTLDEIAQSTGVSVRTVTRQWAYARSWLTRHVSQLEE